MVIWKYLDVTCWKIASNNKLFNWWEKSMLKTFYYYLGGYIKQSANKTPKIYYKLFSKTSMFLPIVCYILSIHLLKDKLWCFSDLAWDKTINSSLLFMFCFLSTIFKLSPMNWCYFCTSWGTSKFYPCCLSSV